MRKPLIFFLLLCVITFRLMASHIVGGEIYYQYISNNDYIVYLKVYRDCNPGNANFDDPAYITVFDGNDTYVQTITIYDPIITKVEPDVDNPCLIVPDGICVEEAVYVQTVNLPPSPGGYTLTYQRCCRNSTIDNVLSPSTIGSTYTIQIPDTSNATTNSSPYYNEFPPIVICNNEPLNFDHSATDPDGDSLVYSLCDPYTYDGNAQPTKADPPPYGYVTFTFPYSGSYPLSASPALSIDSQTGLVTGTPNYEGQFVVAICVSEYRDGVLLSTNKRDFQFNVTNCISTAVNVSATTTTGDTSVVEGCGNIIFTFSRSSTISSDDLVLYLSLGGSSSNGLDFDFIPDSIIIPAGQTTYQLVISTNYDSLLEALEDIIVNISNDSVCIDEVSATASIINSEEISLNLSVDAEEAAIICDGSAILTAGASGGDGSLIYSWSTAETTSSIIVSPDTTKTYYVEVSDSCGNHLVTDSVTIYVVCDVTIPNVFTPNGDAFNEVFYIENLYMHPNSQLKIFNRWGRMVYKNDSYDNSWNGEKQSDGTYYYILDTPEQIFTQVKSPSSQSYTYTATPFSGFVTIIRSSVK